MVARQQVGAQVGCQCKIWRALQSFVANPVQLFPLPHQGGGWREPNYSNALLEKLYAANPAVVPPEDYAAFLAACR